ncbi:MAG: ABC-2 type transport system ATP-binding protein [Limisphaerales bacterium]|jgi:ABC-2 type transport system ATP-binding protein
MQHVIELHSIVKQFGDVRALDEVSFPVQSGKVFGLLGPNGAGKTTLIRIITGILGPDSGHIDFAFGSDTRIGYMPEERGLYKKMKVFEQLLYLARLKDMSKKEATIQIEYWMKCFEIMDWKNRPIEDLSKGMQQKIQFISTVVHQPQLLILDEPFSGLDPINTKLIRTEIDILCSKGTSVIFSTHRMEQVEEICEEIALVNNGKVILNGKTQEIRKEHKQSIFEIQYEGNLNLQESEFEIIEHEEGRLKIHLPKGNSGNDLLNFLLDKGINIISYHEVLPSINEIFIQQVNSTN